MEERSAERRTADWMNKKGEEEETFNLRNGQFAPKHYEAVGILFLHSNIKLSGLFFRSRRARAIDMHTGRQADRETGQKATFHVRTVDSD